MLARYHVVQLPLHQKDNLRGLLDNIQIVRGKKITRFWVTSS